MRVSSSGRQQEPTTLTAGCGHTIQIWLHVDPMHAAEQIAALTSIECIACAKAHKAQTRNICWADVSRSR
jgi:hypothetical protein